MKKTNLFFVAVSFCFVSFSYAAERVWDGANGADWFAPNVWTVSGVSADAPTNTDTVTVTNGTQFTLSAPALSDTNTFALVQFSGAQCGMLTVNTNGVLPTVALNVGYAGANGAYPGKLVVNGGLVTCSGAQTLGADSLSTIGRLEVVNGGVYSNVSTSAGFHLYSGSVLVSNATFAVNFTSYIHGSSMTNIFEIVDSTVSLKNLAIGRDIGNASGKALRNVLRVRSGTVTVGDMEIGHTGQYGLCITGVVEQTGGSITVASGNAVRLPVNTSTYASSAGFYQLDGGLLTLLNASDSLFLGGRDYGANGFVNMTGGVLTNKGNTVIGSYAKGFGRVAVSGGTANFEKVIQVGAVSNSTGELVLSDNGTVALTTAAAALNVGSASNAIGRVFVNGGYLQGLSRTINIGSSSFGTGAMVMNGGVISNSTTVVGAASFSSGSLIVSNGSFFMSGQLYVGHTNAIGYAEIDGGCVSSSGSTVLGNQWAGNGTLVMNGGSLTNGGFSVGNQLGATGALTVNGGQIYSSGDVLFGNGTYNLGGTGSFAMTSGKVLTATRLVVGGYGSGYATVSGGELEAVGASVNASQNIVVGRDGGTFGSLLMTGGALKGTNTFVLARDGGSTGLVSVAGGDIYVNSLLRGSGVSALNLAGGTLHPYDRSTGFIFAAALTNDIGYGPSGTVFGLSPIDKDGIARTVNATCTLTGNGGLAKRGDGTVYLGGTLTYTGDTIVEAGTLALSNTVASLSGGTISVAAGATLDVSLNRAAPFAVISGQTLSGAGSVTGALRIASGAFIGGGTAGAPGELTILGDLTLDDGSMLLFNMASGVYSRIHVTGNLTLPANAYLTVNGAATMDAQGRVMLTWDGDLTMPSATRWSVTGEKSPLAVLSVASKTLTLSYIKGTVIMLY